MSKYTDCQYVFDGTDTDGTKWYRCITHEEMSIGDEVQCAGAEAPPYFEGRPIRTFTFFVPDQPLFEHRDPELWLDDLAQFLSRTITEYKFIEVERSHGVYAIEVTGFQEFHRFVCVALNLHAEQSPGDTTPTEQGAALDALWGIHR